MRVNGSATQRFESRIAASDYPLRVMVALIGSELLPAFLRPPLMRAVGFSVSPGVSIWAGASFRSKKVAIGPGVFINVGFYHDGYEMLEIGQNVRIGPYVRVITATHEIGPSHQRGLIEVVGKPVRIGDGCWIGSGAIIMPGVVVEPGCVIAASAVLHESAGRDGVYAGNPARRVRELGS